MNKSNLMFVIEDNDGQKFGGYINTKITCTGSWINDQNAFLFSLNSNGRINGMMKFNVSNSSTAFILYPKSSSEELFRFGKGGFSDIRIDVKDSSNSYCYQNINNFDYNGISNALRGTSGNFTPKRITVIQMK